MADHSIKFTIGSVFEGEGFKKAANTVNQMNQNVKKGMETTSQLAGALGQMDQSAGKATIAMTGMLQALMSMNATVIISQTSMIALNYVMGEMVKAAEEAKKKADELKAATAAAFSSALTEQVSGVRREVSSLTEQFESLTTQANAFTAAINGVAVAQNNGGIAKLQLEKLNAMIEAHTEAERQNVEAAYNLKIAIEKSANSEMEWQMKIDAAQQARADNAKKIEVTEKELALTQEKRRELEEVMLMQKESLDGKWKETQKQINALKDDEAKLERKYNEALANAEVLEQNEIKVKQEAANAQTDATTAIRQAELAEKKLTEAKQAREVAESAAKDAAELEAAAKEKSAEKIVTAAEIQQKANDAARMLEQAQRDYAQKLREYNKTDLVANASKDYVNSGGKAGLLPVDVQKSIQTRTADAAVDEAIRTGMVRTVKDAEKLQRQEMREARQAIAKEQRQHLSEMKKYNALKKKSDKALSEADKRFMKKYDELQKAAEDRKKKVAEAQKNLEKQQELQKQAAKDLADIKQMLNKVGLK